MLTHRVIVSTNDYCTLIGSDVDFDSGPFDITIQPGFINGSANISITCDNVVEQMESFSLKLTTDSPQVLIDKNKAMVQIVDTTGKQEVIIMIYNLVEVMLNSCCELRKFDLWSNWKWKKCNDEINSDSTIICTISSNNWYTEYYCYW